MSNLTATLQRAQRETMAYAQQHGSSGRIGRTGRHTMNIHPAAFMNAIRTNGREVVNDKEYWRDQARRHPEIAVKYEGAPQMGADGSPFGTPATRFGKVSNQIRFDGDIKIETDYRSHTVTRSRNGQVLDIFPL